MTVEFQQAQVYQILRSTMPCCGSGCITRDEHDFVRQVQTDKLAELHRTP